MYVIYRQNSLIRFNQKHFNWLETGNPSGSLKFTIFLFTSFMVPTLGEEEKASNHIAIRNPITQENNTQFVNKCMAEIKHWLCMLRGSVSS